MRLSSIGMLSAALVWASSAHAADAEAGKDKAELCTACRGEGGISQTENIPSLAGPARSVRAVATCFLPRRRAQERTDAAGRRADQQRRYPQSRRLLCLAAAAQTGNAR